MELIDVCYSSAHLGSKSGWTTERGRNLQRLTAVSYLRQLMLKATGVIPKNMLVPKQNTKTWYLYPHINACEDSKSCFSIFVSRDHERISEIRCHRSTVVVCEQKSLQLEFFFKPNFPCREIIYITILVHNSRNLARRPFNETSLS